MTRKAKKYLFDIKQSCERILEDYLAEVSDHSALEENELLQDGIERQFIIIGEAVSRLRKMDVLLKDSDRLINRRNTLVHQYDVIKSKTLWTFCKFELPDLLEEVRDLLDYYRAFNTIILGEKTIFFCGLDKKAVASAVETKYKELIKAGEYLEKNI